MEDAGPERTPGQVIGGHGLHPGWTVSASLGLLVALVVAAAAGLVQLGPAHTGWILWPSGVLSSLGAAAVRTAVLAVIISCLLVERRGWAAGFALALVSLVHVADRAGKLFFSEQRPLDPQTGWALSRWAVLVALVLVLLGGVVLLARRPGSSWWVLPVSYAAAMGADRLVRLIPVGRASDSFPSGHASNTMALALAVAVTGVAARSTHARLLVVAAIGLAVLVGISRLTLGFHHPADVLGGWAIALAATLGLRFVVGTDRLGPSASRSNTTGRAP